jgi:hypothetical protein
MNQSSSFASLSEFLRFRESLQQPEWQEVDVEERWTTVGGFVERWYRHVPTNSIWRLVEPDAPFEGLWERVR